MQEEQRHLFRNIAIVAVLFVIASVAAFFVSKPYLFSPYRIMDFFVSIVAPEKVYIPEIEKTVTLTEKELSDFLDSGEGLAPILKQAPPDPLR